MTSRVHYVALASVWLLILAYSIFSSAYSIQRHRAFLTNASDLGQIDQAVWNSLQGRPLEYTRRTGEQNVRLSDHVEPLFVPLSLVFLAYDNVEALLIVQSVAIALGALAVFWIARARLGALRANEKEEPSNLTEFAAVGFAAMYLLFPPLQAANLAEFHAVVLSPPLLLFMYYYGMKKAWGRFALFSILALLVKEEISLLVMVMGAWFAVATPDGAGWKVNVREAIRHPLGSIRYRLPAAIAVLALAWFVITVFVIIPQFSPVGDFVYKCRYVVSEDCPAVAVGLQLPDRISYLLQLFAASGWVSLLDPISLLLGSPLILANVLSKYPAQFSGTFHYSAPVAPYFILAAIGGSIAAISWLQARQKNSAEQPITRSPALVVLVPVFLLALAYQVFAGYTPIGRAYAMPNVTPRNELFARFAAQIPPDAIVSTTSSLNPHLSHRRVLYRYPIVKDAEYVLLDVNESERSNPIDFRVAYNGLIDSGGFGVVDAADGYILLKRGAPTAKLPDAFFSLYRAQGATPQYPAQIDFGNKLRFLGYDILTDQYGRGSVRMYWQRLQALDQNYNLYLFYADEQGKPRDDITYPSPLLFWYPSSMWKKDEVVVGTTVPLDLGPSARLGLGVTGGGDFSNADGRLPVKVTAPQNLRVFDDATWVELGTLVKNGNEYVRQAQNEGASAP